LAEPGVCGGCDGRENFAIRTGNVKQIMIKILIGLSASPTGESFFLLMYSKWKEKLYLIGIPTRVPHPVPSASHGWTTTVTSLSTV
jgi:hypothetical protein